MTSAATADVTPAWPSRLLRMVSRMATRGRKRIWPVYTATFCGGSSVRIRYRQRKQDRSTEYLVELGYTSGAPVIEHLLVSQPRSVSNSIRDDLIAIADDVLCTPSLKLPGVAVYTDGVDRLRAE